MLEERLKDAAFSTPDPERSLKNLLSFVVQNPGRSEELESGLRAVAMLFSFSQFLANVCTARPDILFHALKNMGMPSGKGELARQLGVLLAAGGPLTARNGVTRAMNVVREFKTAEILRITLRDVLRQADLVEIMHEMSMLADVIIGASLEVVRRSVAETHGSPVHESFSVISLGKLGAEELNFSSDVDLMFVYDTDEGETGGVRTSHDIAVGKISNHEYYCKVAESLTRFLSTTTDAGFAYRVDLRLRPEGQRGDIALGLRGYEIYYESWGRAWERLVLLRARPVAGDADLGSQFLGIIKPFVYRKYLDFTAIDEIRRLKTRIDVKFKKGDIKRGYGGIREIEFFSQALQLIYGGREPLLRDRSTLKVLHMLEQKGIIGRGDSLSLSENYRHLRILEHRLQQVNDIQTHTVPSSEGDLESLGRKMGFSGRGPFLADLERRRKEVRLIYDFLFAGDAGQREPSGPAATLFSEETTDADLREYLSGTGLKNVERAVRNIRSIRDGMLTFQTLRGRRLMEEILPLFVESALQTADPDTALNNLQAFNTLLTSHESYLELFRGNREVIDLLTYVFSQSMYLSKLLMSRPQSLEIMGVEEAEQKSLAALKEEIMAGLSEGRPVADAIRRTKQAEESRLGLLFLKRRLGILDVVKGLTRTAEAILSVSMDEGAGGREGMAAIGLGKLGGREITFNSDIDLIFVSAGDVLPEDTKAAERLLRILISYTRDGVAYRADTRLRPEGSKGPLVSSVESFRKYYGKAAAFWEFQALLKARPVAGDVRTGKRFLEMARQTLLERGSMVQAADIAAMRRRIMRELSKEAEGYDIKLGPGGIEEVEFVVQYLQLHECSRFPMLLVQGSVEAIRRLGKAGVIAPDAAVALRDAYLFYRALESLLRLRGETFLKRDPETIGNVSKSMGYDEVRAFEETLAAHRRRVLEIRSPFFPDLSR